MMKQEERSYLPAAGHDWLLPFYDPIQKLLGGDSARKKLIEQASLAAGQRILEIGCGTGVLLLMIKRMYLDIHVVGLDPDPKALARAKKKSLKEALSIQLDQGFSDQLPYPDASFDRVFSSFMFHHLQGEVKKNTLKEARRVLKPGGSLHLLDFAGPDSHEHGLFSRWLQKRHRIEDNTEQNFLSLMVQAGFVKPAKVSEGSSHFFQTAYYQALA